MIQSEKEIAMSTVSFTINKLYTYLVVLYAFSFLFVIR